MNTTRGAAGPPPLAAPREHARDNVLERMI